MALNSMNYPFSIGNSTVNANWMINLFCSDSLLIGSKQESDNYIFNIISLKTMTSFVTIFLGENSYYTHYKDYNKFYNFFLFNLINRKISIFSFNNICIS